jgi:hypothetical protein
MEEVAHRVDEDAPWPPPVQRQLEALRAQLQVEPALVVMAGDAAPALGEALGVAVPAALGDLGAPGDRVPRLPARRREAVIVLAHGLSMHQPASAGPAVT